MKLLSPLLTVLQAVILMAWGVLWISLAGVMMLLTRNGDVALMMARRFWAPLHWRITGSRMTVEPLPDIDWGQPHVFLMNHQSALDIPCAFAALPVNLRFVAKHVLRYVPFLGQYMAMTGMIFVNRSRHTEAVQSMALAGECIRAGASILAFPEGTRSRDGSILPFKKGPFVLALEAGVPIVPVAIEGSRQVLPPDAFCLRRHDIRVKVGRPIETKGRGLADRDALMREVREALLQLHRDIGGGSQGFEAAAPATDSGHALPALNSLPG
ncbi:1-acyl-sn-glycerol-3-phosphate acyltransferase [Pyxidicoccus fallax]|uniref:1-acyl-sn-glycerol-3-phosphate acyltransferase n=1 Tax=Pyxidicoccus fallax TaxID=394095 RepID=A0A848LFL9_9BACT|nr:lysophospholipid acyltransferase family protein [Pyxidicoccus fallax]NMO15863.1 1-acyl-sn-glycerol-3-phosphate acyltransferase [Pyxidicoccus fallax]NPC85975.1 1-acyl-sn-glycerol-3-phosphate acyltransferase [Pyxidicoccus fallax]